MWRNRITERTTIKAKSLLDHKGNWRVHPAAQKAGLVGVLEEVGIIHALTVYRSERQAGLTVIDGHLRKSVDPEQEWPIDVLDVTDAEADYVLATKDPLGALAQVDREALGALLQSVQTGDAAVSEMLAGLAEREGVWFGGNGGGPAEDPGPQLDKAAELKERWQVQVGDLWLIPSKTAAGEHRVVCGDCTDRAVVERVMQGERARLVVTDPSYGVSYAEKNKFLNTIAPGNRIQEPIANDQQPKEETQELWKAAFSQMSQIMAAGAVVYCFMPQGGDQMMMMMMMMMGAGIEPRHELIWLKNNHVLGRVDYAYKHEPILYAWKDGGHKFYGDFQTSILEFPKPQISDMHPTTKPVELIERLVHNSSRKDEIVYDPFLGSGTTIAACERLGRLGRGCEVEPKYVAVTLERLAQMSLSPRRAE